MGLGGGMEGKICLEYYFQQPPQNTEPGTKAASSVISDHCNQNRFGPFEHVSKWQIICVIWHSSMLQSIASCVDATWSVSR